MKKTKVLQRITVEAIDESGTHDVQSEQLIIIEDESTGPWVTITHDNQTLSMSLINFLSLKLAMTTAINQFTDLRAPVIHPDEDQPEMIKRVYCSIFGLLAYESMKQGIDYDGWYSNGRSKSDFVVPKTQYNLFDFRNSDSEFRPKALNHI